MNHSFSALNLVRTGLAATAVAACVVVAAPALAQPAGLPSYATGEESIRGRITSFDGKYRLTVRDDRGFVDNVSLHDGTIINPTGLRLTPGQSVTVLGHNNGPTFEANQIDTPYTSYGAVPYGPGPAYAYGYPAYGYGYGYYGYRYRGYPAYGLGFRSGGFGFRGWF